jgi:hypothetical protein
VEDDREMAKAQARADAANTVRYAHILMEIVSRLVSDMQQAGVLRPSTRMEILEILQEPHDPQRAARALERLQRRIGSADFQEQELKRETPKKKDEN